MRKKLNIKFKNCILENKSFYMLNFNAVGKDSGIPSLTQFLKNILQPKNSTFGENYENCH